MQNNLYQLRNKDRLALGIILTSIFAAFIFTVAEARGQVEVHQSQSSSVNGQSNSITTSTQNGQQEEKTIIHTPNGTLVIVGGKLKYCLGSDDSNCGPIYSLHADGTIRP